MRTALKLAILIAAALCSNLTIAAWEPTFVDNFNGNSLDESSWAYGRENLVRRLHYYDKDAVKVRNGYLELSVFNRAESDRPYTTGAVTTQGIFKQKYGYFEMRAKVPNGSGFWPAFWLFPESGRWTSEIDIVEFCGFAPQNLHQSLHYNSRQRPQHTKNTDTGIDLSRGYNNYALRWRPNRLDYLLNGQVVHSITNGAALANARDEMHVILNLAMSSRFTGWNPIVTAETNLGQKFSVDYIRIYQETGSGRYQNIPAATDFVANYSARRPYDNTTVSANHLGGSPDIMRNPGKINGTFEFTAHKANYSGEVSIFLSRIQSFNSQTGYYNKTAPLESQTFNISMPNVGSTQRINYEFNRQLNSPGAYVVDVLFKGLSKNNIKAVNAARVVQYVDNRQPNTTFTLQGFFRPGSANYSNRTVTANLPLQLHEALMAPHLRVRYQLIDTNNNAVLATLNENVEHNSVGLQNLRPQINTTLDTSRSIALVAEVRDPANNNLVASSTTGVSNTAAQINPPAQPSTPPAPQTPQNTASNTLHGVTINNSNASLDVTLRDIRASDQLLYNIAVYRGASQVGKFTGNAGAGYNPGRITVSVAIDNSLQQGDYRVVTFLHKNNWSNRILFDSFNTKVASNQASTSPTPASNQAAPENTLHSVRFNGNKANLDLTLLNIQNNERLLYNVKFYNGSNLIEKHANDIGSGFGPGRRVIPITVSARATQQTNRVVVLVYKNNWDRSILSATRDTASSLNTTIASQANPPRSSVTENTIHGIKFTGNNANLDLTLFDLQRNDRLLYIVKFYNGNNLIEKHTNDIGSGFAAGRINVPVKVSSRTAQRANRAIVLIYKNNYNRGILSGTSNI